MIQIYDDLIYSEALVEMHFRLMHEQVYRYDNTTNVPFGTELDHRFFGMNWYPNDLPKWVDELFTTLSNKISFLQDDYYDLRVVSLNLQVQGQDGDFHQDNYGDGNWYTLMVFPLVIWKKEWGGEFIYGDQEINYVPGRVIFFDGSVLHRGLSPKIPHVPRITLVYRLKNLEKTI